MQSKNSGTLFFSSACYDRLFLDNICRHSSKVWIEERAKSGDSALNEIHVKYLGFNSELVWIIDASH